MSIAPAPATEAAIDNTTLVLTEQQVEHLRTLLLEDLHERAELLAKAAHGAHEAAPEPGREGRAALAEDARCAWHLTGMQESAALLDLIGWATHEDD